jgi:ADP-heptose:LPS heptosyltransferase
VTGWEHPATLAGPPIDWAAMRRVLVVRPDDLGDVIMCGPALRALRQAAPGAGLDLLVSPTGAAVAPLLPEVDGVVAASVSWQRIDPPAGDDPALFGVTSGDDLALIGRVRSGAYDAAVILTSFAQSPWPAAYLCRFAGIPVRIGMSREFGGAGLTHWVPALPNGMHQVDRALSLLRRVGVPSLDTRLSLVVPPAARDAARAVLAEHGIPPGERYALLLPGASCPARRYDPGRFAEVARMLATAGLCPVVAGTAGEAELVARASHGVPGVVSLAGQFDVPALAAAVAGSAVTVCNNSAGVHLAAALGTPVVVLFAGTERPAEYSPRFNPSVVLTVPTPCSPCRQLRCPYAGQCLDIPPVRVAQDAIRLAVQPGLSWVRPAR